VRVSAGLVLAILAQAPLQCSHHGDDPTLRTEDRAGDALWALAHDFRAKHEDAAARDTLQYLVERYPSSRYAGAARDELAGLADGGP
jgi:outer membrane protein assembly factor BamD (BamD/ComL family)